MTKTCGQQLLALNIRESRNLLVQRMYDWSRDASEERAGSNRVLTPYRQTPRVRDYQVFSERPQQTARESLVEAIAWWNLNNFRKTGSGEPNAAGVRC